MRFKKCHHWMLVNWQEKECPFCVIVDVQTELEKKQICIDNTFAIEKDLQSTVKQLKDERHDLQERLDASLDKYEKLEQQVKVLTELVDAVKSSDFDGIRCEDLPSGNWFDARARATETKER